MNTMLNQFKDAMLDSSFQKELTQKITIAIAVTVITTVLPVGINILKENIETKIAEMKAAKAVVDATPIVE